MTFHFKLIYLYKLDEWLQVFVWSTAIISLERENSDKLLKENKVLKQKVDALEKENKLLKKSIYDLSVKYTTVGYHQKIGHFTIFDQDEPVQDGGKEIKEINLENSTEGRTFHPKSEFKGHVGAVYAIHFSPCGKMLASGSFDKTVRIWDTVSLQKEQACLKGHTLNVSDVCWSNDSNSVLSGAYDQTCKLWDIETNRYIHSFESEGFVQCVMFNPQVIDVRKSENSIKLKNEGMINSLYVCQDGQNIITGDSMGFLKTWDIRNGLAFQSILNEQTKKPISHIAIPRKSFINSYDNGKRKVLIRMYDRGIEPPKTQPRLIHLLKGYKNKGWPIKSSFFIGKDHQYTIPQYTNLKDIYDDSVELVDDVADSTTYEKDKPLEASLLLATGSADAYAYLFNVGGPEGTGELIQRLEGHTDFVYAVDFHPIEPILASCSADCTIKLWAPNSKGKKKN
ncbi:3997_t:CDS:10 [Entrophospora sp. SA101]|nr:3997_t:CDS:10 [Entrophospora sp. SA101]